MPHNPSTQSGKSFEYYADPTAGVLFATANPDTPTARRLRIGQPGNLYLVPVGGALADEKLFAENLLAGEQIDQQCDGIGASTTCLEITAQF